MEEFNEVEFHEKVETALEQVKRVLRVNRVPTYAGDVPHSYHDKV